MPLRHRRRKSRIATQTAELAIAVPQVIAHRITRLALAGWPPSPRDRREFQRMGSEKVTAFHESWHAMMIELWRAQFELALSPFQFWWSPWRGGMAQRHALSARRAAVAILSSGLAPVHRRATANARRLGRAGA